MRGLKSLTCILVIVAFFLTVRIQTKGEILTEPIIDSEKINTTLEQIEEQYEGREESLGDQKELIVNDIINMEISQKAFEVEAENRGITVTDEELDAYIDEQIKFFNEIISSDDYFEDHLQENNLTVEEYVLQSGYDQLETQLMYTKLMEEIEKDYTESTAQMGNVYETIEKKFRETYKDQIERLKRKYGVLDVEEPRRFS